MLGPAQFRWLCEGLRQSTARYKLLASGTPFARIKDDWPEEMLYSYGGVERNMFGEIDFHPASDTETAITFRSLSGENGVTHRFRLTPGDLGLPER